MAGDNDLFDRALLTMRRARAAKTIAQHDFLLERVAEDLRDRLASVLRDFDVCLDLGAHHGLVGQAIASLPSVNLVIQADHCLPLLAQCRGPRLVADEEVLPFADQSLDLVVSGLTLHWVNDLPGTLIQISRALKPDGLFLASLLGGQTLQELREVFMQAEAETTNGASPRVAPFADVREFGVLLQRAGFALPVADADPIKVTYESPRALMHELRAMGATNALRDRSKRPLSQVTLERAEQIYRERFAAGDRVRASFEIITLTGWGPHESQQKPLKPGAAQARLADALGSPERPTGEKANPKRR